MECPPPTMHGITFPRADLGRFRKCLKRIVPGDITRLMLIEQLIFHLNETTIGPMNVLCADMLVLPMKSH